MADEEKEQIIAIRNAVFEASDGASLHVAMQGTIMAQGKMIASAVRDPDEAIAVLDRYYEILRNGMSRYCAEFAN
jgi:hypothetical protein